LHAQADFELKPGQSMLMFGKGSGQDATINPFEGQDCYAVVENLGRVECTIRVQTMGQVVEVVSVAGKERKKVKLLQGYELYVDTQDQGKAKVRITYEAVE
jgi:translation initiation factor IF-1